MSKPQRIGLICDLTHHGAPNLALDLRGALARLPADRACDLDPRQA